MEIQKKKSDFTEEKKKGGLEKLILSSEFWIIVAVLFAIVLILLLILRAAGLFLPESSLTNVIKDVFGPIFAVIGTAVGICFTIRKMNSLIRKNAKDIERQENERFERILTLLNQGGIMAVGAIFNILEDAKKLDPAGDICKEEIQKYVAILCSYLKVSSINKETSSIGDLDNNKWRNDKGERGTPDHVKQRIIELLFPLKDNEKDKKNDKSNEMNKDSDKDNVKGKDKGNEKMNEYDKNNPFHRIIGTFRIDLSLCDLRNIDLSGRIVKNVNFGGSAMQGAKMHDAEFEDCTFWGTYLQSTNMAKSRFTDCNFNESNMIWANLCDAEFCKCQFDNANMSCALLSKAEWMQSHKFYGAILDGADIYLEKRTNGGNLQPEIFQNPNELGLKSVKFAFIHPLRNNGKNMVIDTSSDVYNKKPNRLERYITYLKKLEGDEEKSINTSWDTETIRNHKEQLLELCDMALKYAIVDHSTNLSPERYKELTDGMNRMKEELKNNHNNEKK